MPPTSSPSSTSPPRGWSSTSRCEASPHPASPHLPRPTTPHFTSPHPPSPHLPSPDLTPPHLTCPPLTPAHHPAGPEEPRPQAVGPQRGLARRCSWHCCAPGSPYHQEGLASPQFVHGEMLYWVIKNYPVEELFAESSCTDLLNLPFIL